MKMTLLCFVLLLVVVASCPAQAPASEPPPAFGLHHSEFVIRLLSPLSTRTAYEGDVFTATVEKPAQFLGAVIVGRITRIKKTRKGTGKGKAELQFNFETLTFNSQTARIKAELSKVQNSQGKEKVDEEGHVIGVTSNKKRLLSALVGGGLGAAAGMAAGGARGAAIGGAAGAGLGLVIAMKMTTAASEIEFQPGSLFTLIVSDSNER